MMSALLLLSCGIRKWLIPFFYIKIHVKFIYFVSIFYPFPRFRLQFHHTYAYLTLIAASNTVIDDVTKWVKHRLFNIKRQHSGASSTLNCWWKKI